MALDEEEPYIYTHAEASMFDLWAECIFKENDLYDCAIIVG